jgi:hypothetical protein
MQKKLNQHGYNITSQDGEDGIIRYILKNVAGVPKTCVEFGAYDGKFLSNTYALWHDGGWRGTLVEMNVSRFQTLERKYREYELKIFNRQLTPAGPDSLDALFTKNRIDPEIGVLSIDIDSYDYYIWKHLEYVKPYIVIIEHNQTIPGYVDYHDPEGDVFLRCSAKALETLGRGKGYKLVCCTVTNCIFIKESIFNPHKFPNMPIEFLFDYSGCTAPVMSASQGPANNMVPVFWGNPSMFQMTVYSLKNILQSVIKKKKCTRPSQNVIDHCLQSGIRIPKIF